MVAIATNMFAIRYNEINDSRCLERNKIELLLAPLAQILARSIVRGDFSSNVENKKSFLNRPSGL